MVTVPKTEAQRGPWIPPTWVRKRVGGASTRRSPAGAETQLLRSGRGPQALLGLSASVPGAPAGLGGGGDCDSCAQVSLGSNWAPESVLMRLGVGYALGLPQAPGGALLPSLGKGPFLSLCQSHCCAPFCPSRSGGSLGFSLWKALPAPFWGAGVLAQSFLGRGVSCPQTQSCPLSKNHLGSGLGPALASDSCPFLDEDLSGPPRGNVHCTFLSTSGLTFDAKNPRPGHLPVPPAQAAGCPRAVCMCRGPSIPQWHG